MRSLLLALFFLLHPPTFTARVEPYGARIVWQEYGAHLTCLRRNATLIRCLPLDPPPGTYVVELGKTGPLDGNMRAAVGDTFFLEVDGITYSAPLLHALSIPLVTQQNTSPIRLVFVPMVGR